MLKTSCDWKFNLKLNEYLTKPNFGKFNQTLRIPVHGSILLSKEIKDIIDCPEFQRLKGIRQLGPTIFIFPGADHTRFEHSLGTYHLSLKYIEKLMNFKHFREICDPIDEFIKVTVLCSLLHDIGHYPYSHWIEEIIGINDKFNFLNHEKRAGDIICEGEISKTIRNKKGF